MLSSDDEYGCESVCCIITGLYIGLELAVGILSFCRNSVSSTPSLFCPKLWKIVKYNNNCIINSYNYHKPSDFVVSIPQNESIGCMNKIFFVPVASRILLRSACCVNLASRPFFIVISFSLKV